MLVLVVGVGILVYGVLNLDRFAFALCCFVLFACEVSLFGLGFYVLCGCLPNWLYFACICVVLGLTLL